MPPAPTMHGPPGPEVEIDGRRCLYFAGTAYLNLQNHPQVVRAACEAAHRYGIGAATTRAGFGHQPPVLAVEAAVARYFGRPAAFYYPGGYAGPAVLLALLAGEHEAVFIDEHAHYAIFDAARGCGRRAVVFRHRDASDLAGKLRSTLGAGERPLVMTDGVFAATGRVAPVPALLEALARHPGAGLCLDDAHGVGVLGSEGRGTFEHAGLAPGDVNRADGGRSGPRLYACGTLSKALGGYGGIIAGDAAFIAGLKAASHHYDGCSAPPAPIAAASARALELLMEDPTPRRRLAENARRLRIGLHRIGLDVEEGPTPVVALELGGAETMLRTQARLMDRGVAVGYLRYAGTGGDGALRIAVSAGHTPEMIDLLVDRLGEAL